ncbi:MAG: TIR domain-containing protein [Rikenellaceae bacterium]|nr:TIR domain-containing protein [Rikenellaceae bacterium]
MKYDIFISYSRADLQQVEPFVKMIEQRANVKCWIDWTGIESGSQFEDVIVSAIDSVEVVLFFISENSINSHYAKLEINYAYNVKKRVVPVILDGGNLRGWFLFKFGAVDFIDIRNQRQCDKLIQNLQEWCGTSAPVPTPRPTPTPTPAKTYKVGDYYNDGVREGVVFEVSADGRHGKIVSMKQSAEKLQWSSDSAKQKRLIGADSDTDGAYNMLKVQAISGWREKYPAFRWCADLGEGWYLPAKEELLAIYRNKEILDSQLTDELGIEWYYWSSTEVSEFCAWNVPMYSGSTVSYDKSNSGYVRAVSAF